LLIDGPAAVGKSTLVKMIARKFELQLRADEPHRFTDTFDDHVPVIYLSVPDQVTPKQISLALARYLHLPTRGTKDDIAAFGVMPISAALPRIGSVFE
jgi:hypothetical protein